MKVKRLIELLQACPENLNVVIEARANVPEYLSEAFDALEDGDILQITDDRSLYIAGASIHIIGDKVWDE